MTTLPKKVTTLIFDVDDTLYDVSCGFTAHRNGAAVQQFMVDRLGFPDLASAKKVRDEYFERYHATAKALQVAEREGRFPGFSDSGTNGTAQPRFDPADLSEYWASNLNFELLGGEKTQLRKDLEDCSLKLIAFSNGPRKYVKRVLQHLGLFDLFGEGGLFAVDDVLPHCKPEAEAFHVVFEKMGGIVPGECVMIEDSMKNIRRVKELGLQTILIAGKGRLKKTEGELENSAADEAEATKPGDAPVAEDPSVDVALETVEELRSALPGLWETPAVFHPRF